MNLRTKSVAKWIGALAFAAITSVAQAMPVIKNANFSDPLGPAWVVAGSVVGNGSEAVFTGIGSIKQSVSGFVLGATYDLSFFATYDFGEESDSFRVSLGLKSEVFTVPGEGQGSLLFTAPGDGSFDLVFAFDSRDGDAVLSGLNLVCVDNCPPANDVPEPGTLLLMGLAMAAGASVRRKKPV